MMTRSLPTDFRQLRSMVEDGHKVIAREALAGNLHEALQSGGLPLL
jgi:hypothetical protein